MVFEFVFPTVNQENGFTRYVASLASQNGLRLIEQMQSAAVIEGEWEAAMGFLRQCREHALELDAGGSVMTTVHIYN